MNDIPVAVCDVPHCNWLCTALDFVTYEDDTRYFCKNHTPRRVRPRHDGYVVAFEQGGQVFVPFLGEVVWSNAPLKEDK